MKALFMLGRLLLFISSIRSGSIIVDFNIATNTADNLTVSNVQQAFTSALTNSTTYTVDPTSYKFAVQNVCATANPCSVYASCISINGVASCQCLSGFNDTSPSAPGRTCVDINECAASTSPCSSLANCTNTIGSYQCQCLSGFNDTNPSVPGTTCTDINECAASTSPCSSLANCTNTIGSYQCQCYPGIQDGNPSNPGQQCIDPVTCFNSTTLCSSANTCLSNTGTICANKKVIPFGIKFNSWTFTTDLYNQSSAAYANLSAQFTGGVVSAVRVTLSDSTFNINVVGFRPGSVIAYFIGTTQSSTLDTSTIQAALLNAVSLLVSSNITNMITYGNTTPASSSDPYYGWRTAVIVIGVFLGVALLLGAVLAAVCNYTRRRSGRYKPGTW
ncbi:CD97 antigen-like [Xenopus tropicalis]|uniref:CD97 antigen-like n=1 Tax=Xenopus tropicalis TaxID=8364 RepID=A0A8J1J3F6_XENTR|nr:CD97 antigen-like [Xenopus tropicalis]